ncbi:SpnB-like Rossmann fold domain-containing protein [Kitasatospora sp. NPDC001574]
MVIRPVLPLRLTAASCAPGRCRSRPVASAGKHPVLADLAEAGTAQTVLAPVRTAEQTLALLHAWLDGERTGTLVLVTEHAVATHPGEDVPDPAAGAVWGLVRSAQAEHPDRFVLLDVDTALGGGAPGAPGTPGADRSAATDPTGTIAALSTALSASLATGEPQLALRAGEISVPRLVRTRAADLLVGEVGAVIGAHVGPGLLAVVVSPR